jgi:hypothetical protein
MPSPFPGMDPYLEAPGLWPDLHGSLIAALRLDLNARLPDRYFAAMDVFVWIEAPDTRVRAIKPDVPVVDLTQGGTATLVRPVAAPVTIRLPVVYPVGQRRLRVWDREDNRVVTAVEILSPSNKTEGPDRDAYLAKRNGYLASGVNLVEIDLLRAGLRPPLGENPPDPSAYYVIVSRGTRPENAGYWPIGLRDRLPDFPLPLDAEEPDLLVSLQRLLDGCYDGGRFARRIDYTSPPQPPLPEPDATWARELLAARLLPDTGISR